MRSRRPAEPLPICRGDGNDREVGSQSQVLETLDDPAQSLLLVHGQARHGHLLQVVHGDDRRTAHPIGHGPDEGADLGDVGRHTAGSVDDETLGIPGERLDGGGPAFGVSQPRAEGAATSVGGLQRLPDSTQCRCLEPMGAPCLDGDETFENCRRRVLEREVEHRLAAENRAPHDLQDHGGLPQALRPTQHRAPPTGARPQIRVERREPGGDDSGTSHSRAQTVFRLGENLAEVGDAVVPRHGRHGSIEPRAACTRRPDDPGAFRFRSPVWHRSCVSAELGPQRRGFSGLVIVVRAGLLVMGLVLALLSPAVKELLPTFVALVAIAAAASIPLQGELARRMQPSWRQSRPPWSSRSPRRKKRSSCRTSSPRRWREVSPEDWSPPSLPSEWRRPSCLSAGSPSPATPLVICPRRRRG